MAKTDKSASCENVTINTVKISTGYVDNLLSQACTVEASTLRLLTQWFPNGAHCASCLAKITGKKALGTFWRGERSHCSCCNSKFSPFAPTIMADAKISADKVEKILICYEFGKDHKETARRSGVSQKTVSNWFNLIETWESYV